VAHGRHTNFIPITPRDITQIGASSEKKMEMTQKAPLFLLAFCNLLRVRLPPRLHPTPAQHLLALLLGLGVMSGMRLLQH
jgi:hypothetical protein